MRSRARGVALRDDARAVGVVGISDGSLLPADKIVRFDLAEGEDPGRRLGDALASTGARAIWFYGGDALARRAAADLTLATVPSGAVFVRRMDPQLALPEIDLRLPSARDRMTLGEIQPEYAPGFMAPETLFAQLGSDVVGVAMSEALDAQWSEVRVFVYPAHRGRGNGTAMFTAISDRLEGAGRLVCAGIDTLEGRGRTALERAGFRLADYYFTARRSPR
ncbi:MAG: hypothetical protein NVSMB64_29310 [Candidatus Velthaea sp.]